MKEDEIERKLKPRRFIKDKFHFILVVKFHSLLE